MKTKNKYNFTSSVNNYVTESISQYYTSSYNIVTESIVLKNKDSVIIEGSASISISGSLFYKDLGELSDFYYSTPVVNIRDVKNISSSKYGDGLVGTSSLWDLNSPIFYISTPEKKYDGIDGSYFPIGKIYRGILPPSYSYDVYGDTLTDLPFYAEYEKSLYTLRPEGNDRLDLTGNIYKRNISPSNISSSGFVSASNLYITGASFQYYITSSHVTVGNLIPYYAVFADVTSSLVSGNLRYSGSALIIDGGSFNLINSTFNISGSTLYISSSTILQNNVTNNFTNNSFNYVNNSIVYSSSSINLLNGTTLIVPSGSSLIVSGTLLVNNIQSIYNNNTVVYSGSYIGDGSGLYNLKIGLTVSASGLTETAGQLLLSDEPFRFKTNISSGLDVSFSDVSNELYIGAFDATYTMKGVSYYESKSFDVKAGFVKLITSSLSIRLNLGNSLSGSGLTSIKIGDTGSLDTIQDIRITATPTFNQLILSSQAVSSSNAVRADRSLSFITFPQQIDVSSNGSSYSDLVTFNLTSDRSVYLKLEDNVYISGSITSKTGSFQYVTGSFYGDGTNLLNVPSKIAISASGLTNTNTLLNIPSQSLSVYTNTSTGINVIYTNSRLEFNNISSSYSQLGVSYYDSGAFIVSQGFVTIDTGSLRNSVRINVGNSLSGSGLTSLKLGATGSIDTVQDIRTTAFPTFAQIDLYNSASSSLNAVRADRTVAVYVQPNQLEISNSGSYGGTFGNVYTYDLTNNREYSIRLSNDVRISGSFTAATASITNLTVINSASINGNLVVSGNLSVLGTSSIIDYTTINSSGSTIVLHSTSSLINGGIKIYESVGTPTTGSLIYDVTNHFWKAGIEGSEKRIVLQSGIDPLTPYAIVYADISGSLTSSIAPILNVDYTIPSWNGAYWDVTNTVNGGFYGITTGSLHLRLKHSNSGSVRPSTSDLRRAELAYNTILGKLWILKENGVSSVEEIFVTNSGTTGSLYLSGSGHNVTGVWSQTGSVYLTQLTGSTLDLLTIDSTTLVGRKSVISLSSSFDTIYYKQGGNTFTPSGTLGLLGNVDLSIITNNVEKLRIKNTGTFLFNTVNEYGTLTIKSATGSLPTKITLESRNDDSVISFRNTSNSEIYKISQYGGSAYMKHEASSDLYMLLPNKLYIVGSGSIESLDTQEADGLVINSTETLRAGISFSSNVATGSDTIFPSFPMWNIGTNHNGHMLFSGARKNKYLYIFTTPNNTAANNKTEMILGTEYLGEAVSGNAISLLNDKATGFYIKDYVNDKNLLFYDFTNSIQSVSDSKITTLNLQSPNIYLNTMSASRDDVLMLRTDGKLIRSTTGSLFLTSSIDGVFHKQGGNSYTSSLVIGSLNNYGVTIVANSNTTVATLATSSISLYANTFISGTLLVTNDVTAYYSSDERLKDDVRVISSPLEKIHQISGVNFKWNELSGKEMVRDYGVIAQEVEKIMPELVVNRDNGYKAVRYEKLIPLLIESIKELSNRVKRLEG